MDTYKHLTAGLDIADIRLLNSLRTREVNKLQDRTMQVPVARVVNLKRHHMIRIVDVAGFGKQSAKCVVQLIHNGREVIDGIKGTETFRRVIYGSVANRVELAA